jgi:hypothetical protein
MPHGNPNMLNNPSPLLSKAEWYRYYINLLIYFKLVESVGLNVVA